MTRERSITPTTFNTGKFIPIGSHIEPIEREFQSIAQNVVAFKAKKQTFVDAVSAASDTIKAVSQGIIPQGILSKPIKDITDLQNDFDPIIARLGEYQKELEQYKEFIVKYHDGDILCLEHYATKTNEVSRFGINTDPLKGDVGKELASIYVAVASDVSSQSGSRASGTTKSKKDKDLPHMLHPLEIINIREAIKFLQDEKQKTVLVDIFARQDDGQIIREKDGSPETHTIALYRQLVKDKGIDQLLIIDPSNSSFSKHIAFNEDLIFAETAQIERMEILAPSKTLKIYSPPEKVTTGPRPDQPRDCTDIAVKMAFGLNKHEGIIDISDLAALHAIKEITNQQLGPESHLFFAPDKAIARIRQSSNDDIRNAIHKKLVVIDNQARCAELFKQDSLETDIRTKATILFAQNIAYEGYEILLKELESVCMDNIGLIGKMVEEEI